MNKGGNARDISLPCDGGGLKGERKEGLRTGQKVLTQLSGANFRAPAERRESVLPECS